MSHYETLGVEVTATQAEIKAAFKAIAQVAHPDRGGDADLFVEVSLAYEILKDPVTREQYDLFDPITERVKQLFAALISEGNFDCDIIETARQRVAGVMSVDDNVLQKARKDLFKLQNALGRVTPEEGVADIWRELLEGAIAHAEASIERLAADQEEYIKLLDRLLLYKDGRAPAVTLPLSGYSNWR